MTTEGASAGALLRAARERAGLHLAALAATIKVSPRKLDALENDRYDELPDATFVRALAQTVCRALRVDAAPVLARLPSAGNASLEHVGGTLNAPFHDRTRRDGRAPAAVRPLVIASAVLMVAAVAVYLLPDRVWQPGAAVESAVGTTPSAETAGPVPAPPPAVTPAPVPAPPPQATDARPSPATDAAAVQTAPPASEPGGVAAPAAGTSPPPAATAGAGALQIVADKSTWVEVQAGDGRVLLSRIVQPGERIELDGPAPLSLVVGNVRATRVTYRDRAVDLAASARDNVARLELR